MVEYIKRTFKRYSVVSFVAPALFFFLAPLTAVALSPPITSWNEVYISAQFKGDLFTQDQICLDQGCTFVFGPDQSSRYYLERTHERGEERFSLRGYVSHERGHIRIEPSFNAVREYVPLDEAALVDALDVLIEDDISDIKPLLLSRFEQWAYYDHEFTVAHYESDRGRALRTRKDELVLCEFTEYERVGDWLVTEGREKREYCFQSLQFNPFGNVDFTLRHSHFLFFLFTHIHEIPSRYLIGLIMMILGVLSLGYHLVKRREVWLFLKPTNTRIAITIIVGTTITLLFLLIAADLFYHPDANHFGYVFRTWIVEYLLEIYLLSCLVTYIHHRRKTARATN